MFMNIKPWAELPNAQLIDWVIASAKSNSVVWIDGYLRSRDGLRAETRERAWDAAWQSCVFTWHDADAAVNLYGARAALFALITYSDCHEYLSMTYEQLRAWAILSEKPQAVLLLTLKWVQEHEHECLVTSA